MHPDSCPSALAGDWQSEIETSAGFTAPKIKIYPWTQRYSSDTYIALLQTHQDHILLEPGPRTRLLAAIGEAIDCAGGAFVMHLATRVCLATRV